MLSLGVLFALCLIVCIDYRVFHSFVHPSILFTAPFIVSLVCGLMNYESWEFDLHGTTALLLILSSALFFLVGLLLRRVAACRGVLVERRSSITRNNEASAVYLPIPLLLLGLAFTVLVYVAVYSEISNLVLENGIQASGAELFSAYDQLSKFGNVDMSIRGIAGQLNTIGMALSYVWLYLFIRNLYARCGRGLPLIGLNMMLAAGIPLLSGARAGLIQWLVAAFCMANMLYPFGDSSLSKKAVVRTLGFLAGALLAALVLFKPFLILLGRDSGNQDLFSYLSMYLGAPIKNLDMYLSGSLPNPITVTPRRWGDQSFAVLYQSLAHWFGGESATNWNAWQPFQEINGHSLGNVYTVFGPMVFDWGIVGSIIAIGVIALLTTGLYHLMHYVAENRLFQIDPVVISYAYVAYGLVFCFFHNFIFTTIVSSGFVRHVLVWLAVALAVTLYRRWQESSR